MTTKTTTQDELNANLASTQIAVLRAARRAADYAAANLDRAMATERDAGSVRTLWACMALVGASAAFASIAAIGAASAYASRTTTT